MIVWFKKRKFYID